MDQTEFDAALAECKSYQEVVYLAMKVIVGGGAGALTGLASGNPVLGGGFLVL
ncbi:MAG: hypothetical protein RKP73_06485 [Candidatus Contendobacter sp.]|nr:hypothetical protein [Candidatus Contendobacter sp.]